MYSMYRMPPPSYYYCCVPYCRQRKRRTVLCCACVLTKRAKMMMSLAQAVSGFKFSRFRFPVKQVEAAGQLRPRMLETRSSETHVNTVWSTFRGCALGVLYSTVLCCNLEQVLYCGFCGEGTPSLFSHQGTKQRCKGLEKELWP